MVDGFCICCRHPMGPHRHRDGRVLRYRGNDRRLHMRMKWPFGILVLLVGMTTQFPAVAWSSTCAVNTRAAMVINVSTGRTLLEHSADTPIPPASITKVLTLYLVFEAIEEGRAHLRNAVFISQKAAGTGGSRMILHPGTEVLLEELIKGMAVDSGNDACVAAAEHIAGSEAVFVAQMNRKAHELGMYNSHFINTNGLPAKGQVTTARDMAKLSQAYLRRFPESLRIHSLQTFTFNGVTQHNRNRLLGHCPGVDGIKTGWIAASGYNLLATAKRGDTRLLVVVLGAPNPAARLGETRKLLEVGFHKAATGASVIELADLANYEDPYGPVPAIKQPHGKSRKAFAKRSSGKGTGPSARQQAHLTKKQRQQHSQVATAKPNRPAGSVTRVGNGKPDKHKHQMQASKGAGTKLQPSIKASAKAGNGSKSGASSGDPKRVKKKTGNSQSSAAHPKTSNGDHRDKTTDTQKKVNPQAKKHSPANT
ncbi:MAG TPA: D-alanyl-D-alanine carboxypeptidase [Syntrophobacteraceae bacterium]|nr:D-alanyl-D-alanine carboxypeptidase [Syntrophobacteraceae bacterium]